MKFEISQRTRSLFQLLQILSSYYILLLIEILKKKNLI